jgi:hypothetical protein
MSGLLVRNLWGCYRWDGVAPSAAGALPGSCDGGDVRRVGLLGCRSAVCYGLSLCVVVLNVIHPHCGAERGSGLVDRCRPLCQGMWWLQCLSPQIGGAARERDGHD